MHTIDPPRPMRGLLVLTALVGTALGAMAGSLIAGTDDPLPSNEEITTLANLVRPDHGFTLSPESGAVEDRASQREHEDFGGLPGWLQVLVGDDTQDRGVHVIWENPSGFVPSKTATPEANAERGEDTATLFENDGWETTRTEDIVEARKGTLLVEFWAAGATISSLTIYRVQSGAYPWFLLAGAVLGGLAGAAAIRALDRLRARGVGGAALIRTAVGLLLVNTAIVFATVSEDLTDGHLDDPLWRAGRWVPFGATMNIALVLCAVAAVRIYPLNSKPRS